ncbi:hypothetical protein PLESTB_001740200 [Pleodorina starrii]|uniref:Uncharacterized protein n=1 Tax=Pleodorina starrii TaxID=330485 RepID=A0A9W6FA46_9CHLO|nr:hypothetical protein PLESTM_000748300 [Pleodorina starrii]GLC61291.1 hypothetical protein PLESTB_001740200 [Pleodorina starrii]GLC74703.1 hypothetical protein PLESTF_001546400 [Pleodorina starrii]
MLGVRKLLRAGLPAISKKATLKYWSAVNDSLGGDGEGLRQQILSENDGFGITAAVVLSAVVAMLAVAPSNFREANDYNRPASYVLYGALALAFFLAAESIIGTTDFRSQTGKVPASRMLEWVTAFKGSMTFEYVVHMIVCLLALSVAAIAMVYLIHGPTAFWIFLAVGCALGALTWRNTLQINATLVTEYLSGLGGDAAIAAAEGEGGGGAGKAACGRSGGGGGDGPRGVRLAAAVHPMEVPGRAAVALVARQGS